MLNVIGTVINWNLESTKAGGNQATRDVSFAMCVSLWVTVLILEGAVLHEHIDGAHAATMSVGTCFVH